MINRRIIGIFLALALALQLIGSPEARKRSVKPQGILRTFKHNGVAYKKVATLPERCDLMISFAHQKEVAAFKAAFASKPGVVTEDKIVKQLKSFVKDSLKILGDAAFDDQKKADAHELSLERVVLFKFPESKDDLAAVFSFKRSLEIGTKKETFTVKIEVQGFGAQESVPTRNVLEMALPQQDSLMKKYGKTALSVVLPVGALVAAGIWLTTPESEEQPKPFEGKVKGAVPDVVKNIAHNMSLLKRKDGKKVCVHVLKQGEALPGLFIADALHIFVSANLDCLEAAFAKHHDAAGIFVDEDQDDGFMLTQPSLMFYNNGKVDYALGWDVPAEAKEGEDYSYPRWTQKQRDEHPANEVGDGAEDFGIGTAYQDTYEDLTDYLIAMVKDLYSIELE